METASGVENKDQHPYIRSVMEQNIILTVIHMGHCCHATLKHLLRSYLLIVQIFQILRNVSLKYVFFPLTLNNTIFVR